LAPAASRLPFTIKGLEQGWLAKCQFKVTGWGFMFTCGMVLRCALTLKPGLRLNQSQQIWQPLSYIAINCWQMTLNSLTQSILQPQQGNMVN